MAGDANLANLVNLYSRPALYMNNIWGIGNYIVQSAKGLQRFARFARFAPVGGGLGVVTKQPYARPRRSRLNSS